MLIADVLLTVRTRIHGYLLSILATGPALRFQELAIPTVPIVTLTQLAEFTLARSTSETRSWVSSIIWVVLSTYAREIRSVAIWRTAHSWVPSAVARTRNVTSGPVALGVPLLAIGHLRYRELVSRFSVPDS